MEGSAGNPTSAFYLAMGAALLTQGYDLEKGREPDPFRLQDLDDQDGGEPGSQDNLVAGVTALEHINDECGLLRCQSLPPFRAASMALVSAVIKNSLH